MSIVDAREPGRPSRIDADICIVGAGAAGITLAAELIASGLEICLVESGGFTPDEETQSLYDLESMGYPVRSNYMSRARYFGGSCNLWAGRNMVLNEIDFERRDWVPFSGWPIPHREIARFYPRAFEILELPSLEQLSGTSLSDRMSVAERRLFENGTFMPTLSLWARSATRFGSRFGRALRKANNVRVVLNASATNIHLNDAATAVESIMAATLEGEHIEIRARQFVLACGGLENARLLLVSNDKQSAGVANAYDLVGRYFMDHPRAVFGRVHVPPSSKFPLLRGRPLKDGKFQVGVGLSTDTQRKEGLLNHYVTFELQTSGYAEAHYQSFIQTMKVVLRRGYAGSRWDFARAHLADIPDMIYLLSPKELMPHFIYRWWVAARDNIPRPATPRTYVTVYFCEQPPNPSSRVTLGEDTDRLGMRRLKLDWRLGDSVRDSVVRTQSLFARELERTGVGRLEPSQEEPAFTDASHHMGTTRMALSPRDGVVDTDCRAHGITNLFIAGSSVIPSAGHANPTFTIVALAVRLADHLRSLNA